MFHVPSDDSICSLHESGVPDAIITECDFKPRKKRVKMHLKSGIRRFISMPAVCKHDTTQHERSALLRLTSTPNDVIYGSILSSSGSIDSFQSATSAESTTSNISNIIDHFGDELSSSRLLITVDYYPQRRRLTIGAKQADNITNMKDGITTYWQVVMTLLPANKYRFKSKYKSSLKPVFDISHDINDIQQQSLMQLTVQYRLYGRIGRTGKKKLAGETVTKLEQLGKYNRHSQYNILHIQEWRDLKRTITN